MKRLAVVLEVLAWLAVIGCFVAMTVARGRCPRSRNTRQSGAAGGGGQPRPPLCHFAMTSSNFTLDSRR
jgi:hypothetical protein